jgi:hypothetical protein
MTAIITKTIGMKAREDSAYDEVRDLEYALSKAACRCTLTTGLSRFVKQLEADHYDSLWLLVDIPTWIGIPLSDHTPEHDPPFFHTETFLECHRKWGDYYRTHQHWGVRRLPDGSSVVGIYGGVDYTDGDDGDHSLEFFPVQSYKRGIDLPWAEGETEWSFYVGPVVLHSRADCEAMQAHSDACMKALASGSPQPTTRPTLGKPTFEGWVMYLRKEH